MNRPLTAAAPALAAEVAFGDVLARFPVDPASGVPALVLVPASRRGAVSAPRELLDEPEILALPAPWNRAPASPADAIVHLSCTRDERPAGYAQGRTMRGGGTQAGLRFVGQEVSIGGAVTVVRTRLAHANGLLLVHELSGGADGVLEARVTAENRGTAPVTLEMLASFALAGITPFDSGHAPGRLRIHRWRSAWAAEARLVSEDAEDLHLERSWQPHSVACERFGQVGSLPCRGWMPQCAVEDRVAGVTWAARLAWGGSWQMELYRRGDRLALSGGLADRETGHWTLTLAPGERIAAPPAELTVVAGGLDEACERLVRRLDARVAVPAAERDLPVVCNEFCATWGNPTLADVGSLAARLAGSGVRYLVIDAGWYADPERSWFDAHGDWEASDARFPGGLRVAADAVRAAGMVPGLWFELETVGADSTAFNAGGLLQRDGAPLTVARRRFRDLRDPCVRQAVLDRLLAILRQGGFGYLKVDYNETIGIGPDGTHAPGEELRRQVLGIHALFDDLRAALPDLVVEICASGGHRLEASFLERCAMASASDAHETTETAITAAQLARLVPGRQCQVWAVLRPEDGVERQVWALAGGFLGRLCLSGRLDRLDPAAWGRTADAIALYRRCTGVIAAGSPRLHGDLGRSWRSPGGWQALSRSTADAVLAVVHGFADSAGTTARIPLPPGDWRIAGCLAAAASALVAGGALLVHLPADGCAAAVLVERTR